jgi:hypothetical protein
MLKKHLDFPNYNKETSEPFVQQAADRLRDVALHDASKKR